MHRTHTRHLRHLRHLTTWLLAAALGLLLASVLAACTDGSGGGPGGPALVPVGEPRVVNDPNLFRVDGRVQNTATRPYSGLVTVTLFDAEGRVVGVYQGAVNDVPPGEEVTYTAIGPDKPAAWAKVGVRVGTQLPR